ncbi:MAG TPA: tRNA pseudouridine(38-40) synthase TruA [Candidatus Omnitrophica bacterium]|nr:tRNA pseudouridine(38-40) synthase TruA [Candidatus Omnitrophota bacterium]
MRNIRLNIQYDGTNFVGWQRQKDGISVQEVIESAVSRILNQEIRLISAGRTDAGVHARQQVANFFTTNNKISLSEVKSGINSLLPPDIRITSVKQVDKKFHARFDVKFKIYRYFIYNGKVLSPFQYRYIWHIPRKLNFKIMENECKYLIGKKDFKCFQARGSSVKNTVRNVYKARLITRGNYIIFEIGADGFLYKMVRLIVGTLVEIGRGKFSPGWIKYLLKANKDYKPGPVAPPQGLFLWKVVY